ncbi:MAG: FG-GAP repeat domain-containing protein [Verrucomicrobiales bacterium]
MKREEGPESPSASIPSASPQAGPTPAGSAVTDAVLSSIPGVDARALTGREKELMELADPGSEQGTWSSEAFSDDASSQLKALGSLLAKGDPPEAAALDGLLAPDFVASLPALDQLREVFRDDVVAIGRANDEEAKPETVAAKPADVFRRLMAPHAGATDVRVQFKTFRYHEDDAVPVTTAYFQSVGREARGRTQQNAVWTCRWTRESPPRLRGVSVASYERIDPVGPPVSEGGLRFVDVTRAVAGTTPSLLDQMTIGAGHWSGRLDKFYHIDTTGHQGLAIGDANGDGLDDIYVLQQGGLPNRLYLQRPDGTLEDVSEVAGVDWMESSHAALFVDLDNDGDQDLAVVQSTRVLIMENVGGPRFVIRHEGPEAADYSSLAAADYDGDGDVDLFIGAYGPRNAGEHADVARATVPLPYHDSRNGGPNVLLRNEGGWRFADATAASGLDENNDRHSFAASWEDYDNDGDADLYVANDFGRNNLYQNQGRGPDGNVRFKDVAAAAGVEDMSAGMGVVWGDYDRDGRMDLYVSNMFSAAGNRITYQRQFRPGGDDETLSGLRRHARGNSLFQNNGDGTFADVSVEAGVTMGRWAWGSQFADFNNDGWPDLYVVNGYITGETKDDL